MPIDIVSAKLCITLAGTIFFIGKCEVNRNSYGSFKIYYGYIQKRTITFLVNRRYVYAGFIGQDAYLSK